MEFKFVLVRKKGERSERIKLIYFFGLGVLNFNILENENMNKDFNCYIF